MPKDTEVGVIDGDDLPDGDEAVDDAEQGLGDISDDELTDDDLLDEDDGLVAEIGLDTDDDDDLDDDDLVEDDDLVVDVDAVVIVPVPVVAAVVEAEDTSGDEDEDELDDDDVEASLDVILKERLVVEDDEDDEDEDEPADAEDRGDGSLRVLPKQPGEFVCRSCFLVKSETQLADAVRVLCRDCV
jgi:E3 ubiquitin-protein ligase HUWE1